MKTLNKVEWGAIAFAALVILGQATRVFPQLLYLYAGIIIGVLIEKICRRRKEREARKRWFIEHAAPPEGQNCQCQIIPFPGEAIDGGGA